MDTYTFDEKLFKQLIIKNKNQLKCSTIYNIILKSYNVEVSKKVKINQLISSMCRDSNIFKKKNKLVISDFIDVTICLLVADKRKENKEMCKKLIEHVNIIIGKYH
tara:strand:+ start:261 stop:578 length:318 start_codon:yes stop_codon:yes gene_type:complete